MAKLIFIGGMKGGVGKSFTTNLTVYLYQLYKRDFYLVDADVNNPHVADLNNSEIRNIKFAVEDDESSYMSQSFTRTDRLLKLAEEKDVIVNLPSDVENKLIYWLEQNNLLEEDITEGKVKFEYWFLSNGSWNSVSLFLDLLKRMASPYFSWVFVRNKRLCADWSRVDDRKEFVEAIENNNVTQVILPGLAALENDYLEEHKITYSQALVDTEIPSVNRQRIKGYLRKVDREFIDSGALSQLLSSESVEKNGKTINNNTGKGKNENVTPANNGTNSSKKEDITPVNNGTNSSKKEDITPVNNGANSSEKEDITPVNNGATSSEKGLNSTTNDLNSGFYLSDLISTDSLPQKDKDSNNGIGSLEDKNSEVEDIQEDADSDKEVSKIATETSDSEVI